jgi:hypothetical protein
VYRSLPDDQRASVRIIAASYGEAGAIELYGSARGLPSGIVLSGQNSYEEWWPDGQPAGAVITVRYSLAHMQQLFDGCRQLATVTNDDDVHNGAFGSAILVCDHAKVSPAEIRRAVRVYS